MTVCQSQPELVRHVLDGAAFPADLDGDPPAIASNDFDVGQPEEQRACA
jgi:hypothetical protein